MLSTALKNRSILPLARWCLRHQSTSARPNEELIQMLAQCMEEEKASASSNAYKVRAYSKAISAIGLLPEQVRSVDQVRHLDGIGLRIAKRIDNYLSGTPHEPPTPTKSGIDASLQERTTTKAGKTVGELRRAQVVSSLTTVGGIGKAKANALYDAGCRSLPNLREPKFFQMLTRPQQGNVEYMVGLDRTTLEQASAVRDFVTQNVSSKFAVLLGGDFRRGATSAQRTSLVVLHPQTTGVFPPQGSPDVDSTIKLKGRTHIIPAPFASHAETKVASRGAPDATPFSIEIVSPLESRGLVAITVAAGPQKWDGIIRIPARAEGEAGGNGWETRAKRIQAVRKREGQFVCAEIYFVPRQCAGAALIALTGDLQFNLAIRRAASRLGLRLNEYGLWRWRGTGASGTEEGQWELVAGEREEDVFEAVGMEWVAPERRNFANLGPRKRGRKPKEV